MHTHAKEGNIHSHKGPCSLFHPVTSPLLNLGAAFSCAAFNQVFGNKAWSATGSPAMCVWICQGSLVPHPSQMMAAHPFLVLHIGDSLEGRSHVDPGLKHQKDLRHGAETVARRWLTSSPLAGRDAAADPV